MAESFLPWWSVVVAAFAIGLLWKGNPTNTFLAGVLGVGLLWFIAALMINASSESSLPESVANLFQLQSPFLLAAATGLIGGIVGGLGSLSGNYLRKLIDNKESRPRY